MFSLEKRNFLPSVKELKAKRLLKVDLRAEVFKLGLVRSSENPSAVETVADRYEKQKGL